MNKRVEKTLGELATLLNAELRGDPQQSVIGIATLQHARPDQLSFLHTPRYRAQLANTQAGAVILSADNAAHCSVAALITTNPYLAYAKVARLFEALPQPYQGIHPSVVIGEGCTIHPGVSIDAHCVIGPGVTIEENAIIGAACVMGANSYIGASTRLWPRVTLYHGVHLGQRVIVHSGAVLGSDGFGLAKEREVWIKIPQLGGVIVGDDVEIGANTTIDRGALDDTVLAQGVKLDNQVQIGHNVRIGDHTAVAGCVGIAGSATIGKRCAIGGGAGVLGHLTITDDVLITAGTGVGKSITEPGVYSSTIYAQPATLWRKIVARIYRLDVMARKIQALEKGKYSP